MQTKPLTTKALDNFGYVYDVALVPSDYKGFAGEYVLQIKGTPGSWFMSTLADHTGVRMSIDACQKWDCINFGAILTEAQGLLTDEDRAVIAANRAREKAAWRRVTA